MTLLQTLENLRTIWGTKRILTQPKSFTSSLENSANTLNSHAKLNKWGPEKFTKGSMSDLSHLKENPWLPNKLRPYTDSRVTNGSEDNLPVTPKSVSRLSIDTKELRRSRAHSCNSRDSDSSDSLDWIVYANRNSIPLANFGCDEHYRQLSSGSKVLPYNDKIPQSPLVSHSTPLNSGYHGNTRGQGHKSENGDSSISLSGTTSDDTCSSPDILNRCVWNPPVQLRNYSHGTDLRCQGHFLLLKVTQKTGI
ncbi:hypothetical protein DPMN_094070 [Dreissena polymorpha]|uniref:Uncharacterized protein n=1 Tax=Dreissena polymorpha TaxID=45954 RepID=A0A9D4L4F4_DREPO|nr:hypothetical protein DPMN_094070 [Dreissena polymorpha]